MRSLTDFEKDIVKRIHKLDTLDFDELVKPYMVEDLYFQIVNIYEEQEREGIEPDLTQSEYGILVHHNFSPKNREERNDQSKQMLNVFNQINNIERLIRLLEANGLVNIYSQDDRKTRYDFIGNHYYFDKEDLKKTLIKSSASTNRLRSIHKNIIFPTPALEIYVKNHYKTDEQKHNSFLRIINIIAVSAAIIGTILTGIFSTLNYYQNKDKGSTNTITKNEVK